MRTRKDNTLSFWVDDGSELDLRPSIRRKQQSDGTVLVTDGPYLETKEHIGGFWILEAADMDEVLAWARKGSISCDSVGELLFFPDPKGATE